MKTSNVVYIEHKRIEKEIKKILKESGLKKALSYTITIDFSKKEIELLHQSTGLTIDLLNNLTSNNDNEKDSITEKDIIEIKNLFTLMGKNAANKTNKYHLRTQAKDIESLIAILEIGGSIHSFSNKELANIITWDKEEVYCLKKIYNKIYLIHEAINKAIQ